MPLLAFDQSVVDGLTLPAASLLPGDWLVLTVPANSSAMIAVPGFLLSQSKPAEKDVPSVKLAWSLPLDVFLRKQGDRRERTVGEVLGEMLGPKIAPLLLAKYHLPAERPVSGLGADFTRILGLEVHLIKYRVVIFDTLFADEKCLKTMYAACGKLLDAGGALIELSFENQESLRRPLRGRNFVAVSISNNTAK